VVDRGNHFPSEADLSTFEYILVFFVTKKPGP
jgi:hypothetical protein